MDKVAKTKGQFLGGHAQVFAARQVLESDLNFRLQVTLNFVEEADLLPVAPHFLSKIAAQNGGQKKKRDAQQRFGPANYGLTATQADPEIERRRYDGDAHALCHRLAHR